MKLSPYYMSSVPSISSEAVPNEQQLEAVETASSRKNAYNVWLAAYQVFANGYRNMQMSNKKADFWKAVAEAIDYKNHKTVQNRFGQTMSKLVKEAVKLAGPNNTGGGKIDYLELTGIKNVTQNAVRQLVENYADIIGDTRKWKDKDESAANNTVNQTQLKVQTTNHLLDRQLLR